MTDYPHWPFGVSPINRGDRALRELFGVAYYPLPAVEGEPATADRQAFVNAVFGDIFDVVVADEARAAALDNYRALVVGGRVREWSPAWAAKLESYVRAGGTILFNEAQAEGLREDFLGVRRAGGEGEADEAVCHSPGEAKTDLRGQVFRFARVVPHAAATEVLLATRAGEPLVTVRRLGRGRVIYCAIPDLLGLDERFVPAAAHLFAHLTAHTTPIDVAGDVEYSLNRNDRGWVVTLFNNRGVTKHQQGLAQVDRREVVTAAVTLRGARLAAAREWIGDKPLEVRRDADKGADGVRLDLPPGAVAVVELVEK
jgi:hypothetical protein